MAAACRQASRTWSATSIHPRRQSTPHSRDAKSTHSQNKESEAPEAFGAVFSVVDVCSTYPTVLTTRLPHLQFSTFNLRPSELTSLFAISSLSSGAHERH